jgi:hypothetical protein
MEGYSLMSFNDWLNSDSPSDEFLEARVAQIAIDQWSIIQENRHSIVVIRGSLTLDAQTVSIQPGNEERQIETQSGKTETLREVVIFGIKGHPTIPDTSLEKDDQFEYLERLYKVTDVIVNQGSCQAWAEALG